jgi:hypothetical protein
MDIEGCRNVEISPDFKTFSFISAGPKGNLMKIAQFVPFDHIPDVHNLALGTTRGSIVAFSETPRPNTCYYFSYSKSV